MIDPARGGLVSRAHGGGAFSVTGPTRRRLIDAQAGARGALTEQDADLALQLIERCLAAHAGLT
jgi:DNA repair protein RecO (recombination protein O)